VATQGRAGNSRYGKNVSDRPQNCTKWVIRSEAPHDRRVFNDYSRYNCILAPSLKGDTIKKNYVKDKEALLKLISEADISSEMGKSLISKLGITAGIIQSHPGKEMHVIAHSSELTKKTAGIAVSIENLAMGFAGDLASKMKRGDIKKVEVSAQHAAGRDSLVYIRKM